MITISQRIQALRSEKGLSKSELSKALGFSPNAIDRFESGKLTPNKEQQEKLANFFAVSLPYLRAETNDPTRQDSWMDMTYAAQAEPEPSVKPQSPKPVLNSQGQQSLEGPMLLAMLKNPDCRAELQKLILETLRSPQGKAVVRHIVEAED